MKRIALGLAAFLAAGILSAVELQVWIDSPPGDEFVYGIVDVVVAVSGDEAESAVVEFFLDGKSLGTMIKRPFRLAVDVGDENVSHDFKVVARTPTGATATATTTTPTLQVDDQMELNLQQFYITATDESGRVLDLDRSDFRIVEDGESQKLVTFERGDVPLTSVLLLDCSLSMTGRQLAAALEGASLFVKGMNELDETMVMLYSDRLLRSSEFSKDPEALRQALSGVAASGGTSINDHLFLALKQLDVRQGRSVVVLFSDGADVHSALSMSEVLEKVRRSQSLIYWIYLRQRAGDDEEKVPTYMTTWRSMDENANEFRRLRQAVSESGGRVQVVDDLEQLDEAFVEIMRELREQYVLGYYPTNEASDGEWREVRIRVKRSGVKLRAREGYVAY